MLGHLKQGGTHGWRLEAGPYQIHALLIMLSRIQTMRGEEGLLHVLKDEVEMAVMAICKPEGSFLEHQDEEIDPDVENLSLLGIVNIPQGDFRSHILGSPSYFIQRNSNLGCMAKVNQHRDAVCGYDYVVWFDVKVTKTRLPLELHERHK